VVGALVSKYEMVDGNEADAVRVDKLDSEIRNVLHGAWSLELVVLYLRELCRRVGPSRMKVLEQRDAIGISIEVAPSYPTQI
jgi:hypothetical protein